MVDDAVHFDRGPGTLTVTDRELFERLTWFTHVRWIFGLFCLLVLLVSWYGFGARFYIDRQPMTMGPAVHVILLLLLYNALFTFLNPMLRDRRIITHRLIVLIALAQVVCDLAAITALVHYTGGIENPFIILILVPLAIVSELLPQGLAYATAAAAAALLNGLAWGQQQGWMTHVHSEQSAPALGQAICLYADWRYVLTTTAALTVTMFAMVFVATTIAARLRARDAQLQQAYNTLHSTDEAKSFFMRRAEHEMRAPLAAIHSLLDAMMTGAQALSPDQQEVVSRARRRTTALMELVKDLRRYSRFRTPDRIFEIQRFPLDPVLANTIDLFRPQAEQKGLTLTASIATAQIEGNEEMMRELVTNRIANAVQYTPAGGSVDARLQIDTKNVTLRVADTGIGMTPETQARIFEEFYRAPEAKQVFQDGTGLGMAIVNRIVQIHHGQIDIQDNPGGGTVFRVRLPMRHQAGAIGR
ncbi:MAG: sensor histidine kinase [Planctomycetota bacterium]|jgi:signal transduction histidine kinase